MKKYILLISFLTTFCLFAQTDYNTKKGLAVKGYDVTEYFNNKALKGSKEFSSKYDDVLYYFTSRSNKEKFDKTPGAFLPEYGGYCAYAIGLKSEKVDINPKSFEIKDNKLYLFYNAWGVNTLDLWNKSNPKELKEKADANWKNIKKLN